MNSYKFKEILKTILAVIAIISFYRHPFVTIGIVLAISAIAIPILIQLNHRGNLKIIDTKVKHSLNCEFCGSEIVSGRTNCPNCGAPYDLENSKDLVKALSDEKVNYNEQTKMSFTISKFLIFLLFIPIFVIMIILVLAFLNDGQISLKLFEGYGG